MIAGKKFLEFTVRVGLVFALGSLLVPNVLAGIITNPSFELGDYGPGTSFTGPGPGGSSAATGWWVYNNSGGVTSTELCGLGCPSGSTPPPPFDGSDTIHITTTGSHNGITQFFTATDLDYASVWLDIVSGSVWFDAVGAGGDFSTTITSSGLAVLNFGHLANINQIVIYGIPPGGSGLPAEFYADNVNVGADSDPVPEPTTLSLTLGGGLLFLAGLARRRRSHS